MNATDYQQKRAAVENSPERTSKGKGPSNGYSTPSTVETTPPRLVTPNLVTESPTGDLDYRHKPTASSYGTNFVSPLKAKEPNMRYQLNKGRLETSKPLGAEKENLSKPDNQSFHSEKPSSKSSGSKSSLPPRTSSSKRRSSGSEGGSSKSKLLSSSLRKHDPNSCKIFILLLQPKLKTFELIQLIYSSNDTTVGNIIAMIPENATEPALGSQKYVGLCRPKTEEEILDHDILASEPRATTGVESAKITMGEILVAIPDGYSGADVAILAKQILSNPKIVKLLKRSDPLAPKRRRSSKRGHPPRRSRSKEHVDVMEKFDEEDEMRQEQEIKQQEKLMKEAMEHAAQEAAAANAEIPGIPSIDVPRTIDQNSLRSSSIGSLEGSLGDEKSVESSLQESIDESYSSWSKSFDASFATTVCSGVSKRSVRRRDRQSRRMKIIQRSVVAGFVLMLAMYFVDPHGYGRSDEERQVSHAATTENPMGLTGIFQCLFLLLFLYQVEAFIRTTSAADDRDENRKSSFIEFLQSTKAMKKLKARFAKKLKKPSARSRRGAVGAYDYDENSRTQKLRSFSLKGSNHHLRSSSNLHDVGDTGSL
mmetsp:Transcript_10265/g.30081  ORF Transcript_10265/g.30081 Transcript_10265/m.30081 type:complete len:593 (-) Transcript_10265:66-1844(-)